MVTCFSSAATVRIWRGHKIDKWRNTLSINWTYLENISLWDWLEPSIEMGDGRWEAGRQIIHGSQDQDTSLRNRARPGNLLRPAGNEWQSLKKVFFLIEGGKSSWNAFGRWLNWCLYMFLNSYYLTFAVSRAAWLNGPNVTVTFRSCVGKFYQFGWWSLGPGQHSVSCALGT